MYAHILLTLLLLLALPTSSFAAFNDTTLTTDTVITAGGVNLNVSGSSAVIESITVTASNFSFVLLSGSSIRVVSPDRWLLTTDAASTYIVENRCTDSGYVLEHSSSGGTVTITVTPQATGCGGNTGGGGGSSAMTYVPIQPAAKPTAPPLSPQASIPTPDTSPATPIFVRNLSEGAVGDDVKLLQKLLNAQGFNITNEGAGSVGRESTFFGRLTKLAVQKFQEKYALATALSLGYGNVGPKTRAKLEGLRRQLNVQTLSPSVPAASVVFPRRLSRGMSGADVLRLQVLLNSDPGTRVGETGPASPGNETEYFGTLTEQAVGKFQEKYGIATQGTPGYGNVGPKTLLKLNELAK